MKKTLLALLWLLLVSPSFAQVEKVVKAGVRGATQSQLTLRVFQQAEKSALARSGQAITRGQVTNWVNRPSVQVLAPGNVMRGISAGTVAASSVTMQVMDFKKTGQYLFPAGRDRQVVYIPEAWKKEQAPSWYRGLHLTRLADLKNILEHGMELDKTNHYGCIFATSHVKIALGYSVAWGSLYPGLPVMVRIPESPELPTAAAKPGSVDFMRKFNGNIAPSLIADVMVFLEVNGIPGWYKVVLHEGELLFKPVSGSIFVDGVKE